MIHVYDFKYGKLRYRTNKTKLEDKIKLEIYFFNF